MRVRSRQEAPPPLPTPAPVKPRIIPSEEDEKGLVEALTKVRPWEELPPAPIPPLPPQPLSRPPPSSL